jgi:tetratricopeptide (TPR) repeat protein
VFFSRKLVLVLSGAALLALGLGLAWRSWKSAHSGLVQIYRIAILAIDNQTGDPGLNWAGDAIRIGAILELGLSAGQGDQALVFSAHDAGEASARRATHLVYGRLEPGTHSSISTYSISIEEFPRHSVVRRVRGSGSLIEAASALARLVAPEAGVQSLRPAGVGNDQAFEFFSKQKYAECTGSDPQAFWCWERWATSVFEAGKKDEALTILARGREQATRLPAAQRARLDLVEASIRGDEVMRMAALERLAQADDSNPAALAEWAGALMAHRRFSQAETLYRTALQRNGKQAELWNLLAYAQAWQNRFEEARKSLVEYDRLAPAGPNPPDSRGEIEWMAGNLTDAATWFQDSYRRDSGFNGGVALEKAALSRYLSGDARGMEGLLNKYLSDRDRAGDVLAAFHRARWQFLLGDFAGGEALLQILVKRGGPDAAVAALRLTLISLRDQDLPSAKKWARMVRELTPETGNKFLPRVAGALVEGDASAVSDPALSSELLALRLTLRGQFDAAVTAWDLALAAPHNNGDSVARELKAWCLLRAGKNTESAGLVTGGWPLFDSDERLLFDFLIYPNLLFVRAEGAAVRGDAAEARRLYDLYLRYASPSKDHFGQRNKARSASRL